MPAKRGRPRTATNEAWVNINKIEDFVAKKPHITEEAFNTLTTLGFKPKLTGTRYLADILVAYWSNAVERFGDAAAVRNVGYKFAHRYAAHRNDVAITDVSGTISYAIRVFRENISDELADAIWCSQDWDFKTTSRKITAETICAAITEHKNDPDLDPWKFASTPEELAVEARINNMIRYWRLLKGVWFCHPAYSGIVKNIDLVLNDYDTRRAIILDSAPEINIKLIPGFNIDTNDLTEETKYFTERLENLKCVQLMDTFGGWWKFAKTIPATFIAGIIAFLADRNLDDFQRRM